MSATSKAESIREGGVRGAGLSLWALSGAYLLDSLSFSLMLPLLPFILRAYGAGAVVGGALVATHALFTVFCGPLLGRLSDRIGRKQVIVATVAIAGVSYVLFGISRQLWMLFAARALAGAAAGNLGVIRAAAADLSSAEERPKVMGIINAGGAMGFVLGPAIGAAIAPDATLMATLVGRIGVAAALVALGLVLAFLRNAKPAPRMGEPSGAGVGRRGRVSLDPGRLQQLGLICTAAMAEAGLVSMTPFWARHELAWGSHEVGFLYLWVAVFIVAGQLMVVPRLAKMLGEGGALRLALVACVAVLAALVTGRYPIVVLVAGAPLMFVAITAIPTLCLSALSKLAGPDERGALLGLASSASSIGRVLGPVVCGVVFARVAAGAPYALLGVAMAAWWLWLSASSGRASARAVRGGEA